MATRNGSRFIREQLDSLFGQSFQSFRLMVRDDGSTDSTLAILDEYQARYPDRITVHRNQERQGPRGTFSLLSEDSSAPYVALCDQDDIWRRDKLELSIAALKAIEARHGEHRPALVFSDLALIGDDGRLVARSLWKQARVNPARATLGAMLAQNLVTGCTILANRALIAMAGPIPEEAAMHDSWLGLIAVSFGILHPLYETTVQYRQHEGNVVGAGQPLRPGTLIARLRRDSHFRARIEASRRQAECFATRYSQQLTARQRGILAAWSKSRSLPALVRHWTLQRNGLRGTSFLNNLGFLVRV